MESTSDEDDNFQSNQGRDVTRKFYKGQETSGPYEWKGLPTSASSRRFQGRRGRGRVRIPTGYQRKTQTRHASYASHQKYKTNPEAVTDDTNVKGQNQQTNIFLDPEHIFRPGIKQGAIKPSSEKTVSTSDVSDEENASFLNCSGMYSGDKSGFVKTKAEQHYEFLPDVVNLPGRSFKSDESAYENMPASGNAYEYEDDDPVLEILKEYEKKRQECVRLAQSLKPSDLIMGYRKRIEAKTNSYIADNEQRIESIREMMSQDEKLAPCFGKHEENLRLQQEEFENFVTTAKNDISLIKFVNSDNFCEKADDIILRTENECSLFTGAFPAYGYKSQILDALTGNQVVIISSDCSYFFSLVVPAVLELNYPDHFILHYESTELVKMYVEEKVSGIIRNKKNNPSRLFYVSDDELIRIVSSNIVGSSENCDSGNFIVFLNIPLKRSVNLDLSLALLRDQLSKRKNSALILLTSIYDDRERYQRYFRDFGVFVLQLPRLLLPVTTVWKEGDSENYKKDAVQTALSVHVLNNPGNILLFLPNEDEAKLCKDMLENELRDLGYEDIKCKLLQDNQSLSTINSLTISNVRLVFFASEIAEIIPIMSVKYVIDCGRSREHVYDAEKKVNTLRTHFCSRARAKLRKSLCGVFRIGVCYRMYNKSAYCLKMPSQETPEYLTLSPFDALIKTFQVVPKDPLSLSVIEPLKENVTQKTVKKLNNLKMVKGGTLTKLGMKIAKLPLPIEYSTLIHLCIGWGYGYEAAIIVSFFMTDLFVFKISKDEETQRLIDASKLELIQHESDPLTYLYIYKKWRENDCSESWCKQFYISYETLVEVKKNVSRVFDLISMSTNQSIHPEFNSCEEAASDLIKALFQSFADHFCIFSGHYRSGYQILASSETGYVHPSSVVSSNCENPPQFLIFNKIICSSRSFLVGITALDPELVHETLTESSDCTINYDLSDMYEKQLVMRTIEPVGERVIKQVLLGKKGHKLAEIEAVIKGALETKTLVIDPIVEKGCVNVYALPSCVDEAVEMVEQVLKDNVDQIRNAEKVYTLELKKRDNLVTLEVCCSKGAKIVSVAQKRGSNQVPRDLNGKTPQSEKKQSTMQYSINLTWVRRPCSGKCFVSFSEENFPTARKLSSQCISVLGCDVYVEANERDCQLVLLDVPPEARLSDIEEAVSRRLPRLKIDELRMLFKPGFETSMSEVESIKEEIEEICNHFTRLTLYEVIVPKPKNTATIWTAYVNVFCTEDLTDASEKLSNVLIRNYRIHAMPVYRSVISTSLKIFKALEKRLNENIADLKKKLSSEYPGKDPFTYDHKIIDQDLVLLKLLSNDVKIMKCLQNTVNHLLEGEVLDRNAAKDINKLFCHGGHLWLKTLERYLDIHILEEYNSKTIRIYGSARNCFRVRKDIISFLDDTENDALDTVVLNSDNKNRTLLKGIIKKYGVNLESFIEENGLCSATLDIKSNRLFLQGNREKIEKAKEALDRLSRELETAKDHSLVEEGEKCPVCTKPAFNLTFRLQNCNHLYCRECILGLVLQTKFPKQCCAENCSEDIVLDDIERILDEDEEQIKKILQASLNDYLERNRADIIDCPAPDCSMFFSRKDAADRMTCPLCQNEICTRCSVVYHHGYTCDIFKGTQSDPDYSLKVYKENKANSCKDCPKCKVTIQRSAGCDHMTCSLCQAHFCWVCCREFPKARDVYNHIPFCDMHPKW